MSTKLSTQTGNIKEFKIFQAKDGGNSIDASGVVSDIKYYEDVLSNSVSLSVVITSLSHFFWSRKNVKKIMRKYSQKLLMKMVK